jgi:hypothetical protein
MSKPRIFVSSTYYDLKHVRSSLEAFIERLGYEPILSEKGDIAYAPDIPLDESCYREVRNADVFVLIIGGRYGSEKSDGKRDLPKNFYQRYDSITKQEYKSAIEKDIPIYILIEKSVYADFETYLRNKENSTIVYVDSVNIFNLVEEILCQPRNNPINYFDRYTDIETWLRDQWAGLFREILSRMSSQQQLSSLTAQVGELREVNKTLRTYLEEVVSKIAPGESAKIIRSESKRLDKALQSLAVKGNALVTHVTKFHGVPLDRAVEAAANAKTLEEFVGAMRKVGLSPQVCEDLLSKYLEPARRNFEKLKQQMAHPEVVLDDETLRRGIPDSSAAASEVASKRKRKMPGAAIKRVQPTGASRSAQRKRRRLAPAGSRR